MRVGSGIPLIDRERMFVVDLPVSPLLPIVIPSQDVKAITRALVEACFT